jgi:drug/metabolite transporter (DMT)-like permease
VGVVKNPYVQIAIGALLVTISELLLKKGAVAGGLTSGWTWIGITTYILSFLSWLYVLRHLPLSVAYPLISVVHLLVPLGAWLILGEMISTRRWIGIACVFTGVVMAGAAEK